MFSVPIGGGDELRLLEPAHADALFALVDADRARLREWLPWVDATRSSADSRAFIRSTLEQLARGAGFQAGIWSGGELVGVIGFHPVDWADRSASIGYWLAARAEGRGLVARAAERLVDHAFSEWGLHRVEIRVGAGNPRSRRVPERLGFREEGVLRGAEKLHDRFVDLVVYGVLRDEWRARASRR